MNLQLRYNFFFCFSERNRLGFLESFLRNQDQFKNSDTVLEGVVGADAYIGPAECAVFMEIFSEFVTSQRADVGIGPYRAPANPHCLANFERKALLPQILNRNYSQICCTVTVGA